MRDFESTREALLGDRERLLDPVDRVSEIIFGLIMAVTIVGSLSVATAGQNEVRTVMSAALGCNLAWGLVDAVMYLVRTLTARTRIHSLAKLVVDAEPVAAREILVMALPEHLVAVTGDEEIEGMRRRIAKLAELPSPHLRPNDYLAAFGVFLLVVVATFPVVVPFMLAHDVALAMQISRSISLVMLFVAGLSLGRYAGHAHPWLTALGMLLIGATLIVAVKALGG